jgi:hypothetical protein
MRREVKNGAITSTKYLMAIGMSFAIYRDTVMSTTPHGGTEWGAHRRCMS